MMKVKLFGIYNQAHKAGLKIYGVKTDCILVAESEKKLKRHFNFTQDIGGLKFETGKQLPSNAIVQQVENKMMDITPPKVTEHHITDEYSEKEFKQIFDKHNRILIKGVYPGVGKSQSVKNYAKANKLNILFAAPTNKLSCEIKKQGFDACTIHTLIGCFGTNDGTAEYKKMKKMDISDYNAICFDEIFMMGTGVLKRIMKFMCGNDSHKFFATGDPSQLPPIREENIDDEDEENLDDIDDVEYQRKCINIMFPDQINIKINKRLESEEDKQKLYSLKDDIFDMKKKPMDTLKSYGFNIIHKFSQIETLKNISYFNNRAKTVSKYVHKNLVKQPKKCVIIDDIEYYKSLNIVCRKRHNTKEGKIYINYTYKIVFINDKTMTILDENDGSSFEFPTSMIRTHFKLEYCMTVFCVQGCSIEEKITLFDCNTCYVDRRFIWTAITRATKLDNIVIFEHNDTEIEQLIRSKMKQYILMKCENYKNKDQKADRTIDKKVPYVSGEWFGREMDKCKGVCACCKKTYELTLNENNRVISNITADRIDNALPHYESNVRLRCLECNRSRGNHY
jgi:hypothetical protein